MSFQLKPFLWFVLGLAFVWSCAGNSASNKKGEKYNGEKIRYADKSFDNQNVIGLLDQKLNHGDIELEFENCTFNGSTSFLSLRGAYGAFPVSCTFINCIFEGDLNGNMVQFSGSLNFTKCRFKKNLSFQNSTFTGPAAFRDCTFDQEAKYQNAIFLREATWMGSHFYGTTYFQSSRFFEKAQFMNVVFHANTDFTICRFSEGAIFDFSRSEGNLDFSESRIEGKTSFRKAIFVKRIVLKNIRSFAPIKFLESNFSDSLVTTGAKFFAERLEVEKPVGSLLPTGF